MSNKHRRKSLSIFRPRAEVTIPASSSTSPTDLRSEESPVDADHSNPQTRPRVLNKGSRTSVFGSWRSLHSLEDEEKLIRTESTASFFEDENANLKDIFKGPVLHFGEVQSTNSVFHVKKRAQYLVLTESHLIRFKSQNKAAEAFPTLPATLNRSATVRGSHTSIGSYHDMQVTANTEITYGIALDQVVAAYKLDDGRPFFTIEVSHHEEQNKRASSLQMQFNDPREADQWLRAILSAVRNARTRKESSFSESTLEHIARALERERDYAPENFQVFRVIQRAAQRSAGRSSAEDLSKLSSTICYFCIGINKVHLVPLPRSSGRSSSASLVDLDLPLSFGIVTLASIALQAGEHAFQLMFKAPLQSPFAIHLASSEAEEIALSLKYAAEYLRPEWTHQPFAFNVPAELEDQPNPTGSPEEDHQCFERTLIAYCAAFDVDTSKICYTVDYDCEDAPCFRLLPSSWTYNALELLAVFRALRYNQSFVTISFANVDLRALRHLYDPYGSDTDAKCTRSGIFTNIQGQQDLPILSQEIRALALKSTRLRRLDFAYTLVPSPGAEVTQHSSGIPEALVPLCKKSLTNVDWFILTGIPLTESDLDFLVDAASERKCHLRALEIGECGLSVHDANVLLSTLSVHEGTMEVIDISGAQGRFSPELFQQQIGCFSHIRRLNLTRVQKTAGSEPLIAPESLLAWRLEGLYLSQTTMTEQAVDSVSAYLACPKSDILRELHVNQCGLTGKDLAVFFQSMDRKTGALREMHISASENRLKIGCHFLFQAIGQNFGPSHLTVRMMDFEKEHHFRELVEALTQNTTLRKLDISKASLPYDASNETCEALRKMFAENNTLQELDISGEQAHLDVARFGIGLNLALRGLKVNKSLKILKVEHQDLGLQGANTLAELLEENDTLVELHCDNNQINLQSFTVLVDALQKNKKLLYMPSLDPDRAKSLEKVRREFQNMDQSEESKSPLKGGAIKRTLTSGLSGLSHHRLSLRHSSTVASIVPYAAQDLSAAMNTLNEKWDHQVVRTQRYLMRNYHLANGIPWDEATEMDEHIGRVDSLSAALDGAQVGDTAKRERSSVEFVDEKLGARHVLAASKAFELPED